MTKTALEAAGSLLDDVYSLLNQHPAKKDPRPGRPEGSGYGPLLRASTALCYTVWEVYVEEALLETIKWLVNNRRPEDLPAATRKWVSDQQKDPWDFVGDSWRISTIDLVRIRLEGVGGRYGFNTASVPGVQGLYEPIIGYHPLKDISWPKKSNSAVRKDISRLVKIRGEIVHRGSTPGALDLKGVRAWANFVRRLTEKFDERLMEFRKNA